MHTGFVQRGLPRSSPKNAAAPLYEQNLVAIDRKNITWKQNHSSCGSRMIQSEPECLAHDGSSLVVPKPRSVICVRARNSSVTMSAALWEIGDPNTLMNTQTDTMSGKAARPPCAREAVAAELGTIRERVFEARERNNDGLRAQDRRHPPSGFISRR